MASALECFRANHTNEPPLVHRIYLGFLLTLFTIMSYILNLLLLIIVTKTSILDRLFCLHVVSLTVAGIFYSLANTMALIPTIVGFLYIKDPWNPILSTAENLGYLALMFTTTNIAVDRSTVFFLPQVYRFLRSRYIVFVCFSSIPWLCSVLVTVHMTLEGCFTRTDPYTLAFTYRCSECVLYGPVLLSFGFIFPGISCVLYALIYSQIVIVRSRLHSFICRCGKRKEIELVIQFSLICGVQFASSASFYVLPALLPGYNIAYQLPMIISTLNTITNPVLMLVFRPRIRDACTSLITKCSAPPPIVHPVAIISLSSQKV
ncbi:hypothetical protein ANCCAN_11663 [Ancylostoma caninum]|uniref:G-protein coupled receptors family 1 profile domain-containing protein n=1 Tax=Ancylostoma caninum TaxID=29170 RepID=A0A368GD83_ANCCA|nr:hypothetical protein ANCCAN_11663 [Ancylostoma caninum]